MDDVTEGDLDVVDRPPLAPMTLFRPTTGCFSDGLTPPLLLVVLVRLPAEGATSFETRPALIGLSVGVLLYQYSYYHQLTAITIRSRGVVTTYRKSNHVRCKNEIGTTNVVGVS